MPHYTRYNSFGDYFDSNIFEGVFTATTFSIVIPLLDNFLKRRERLRAAT
jgi:hypothetical protein